MGAIRRRDASRELRGAPRELRYQRRLVLLVRSLKRESRAEVQSASHCFFRLLSKALHSATLNQRSTKAAFEQTFGAVVTWRHEVFKVSSVASFLTACSSHYTTFLLLEKISLQSPCNNSLDGSSVYSPAVASSLPLYHPAPNEGNQL